MAAARVSTWSVAPLLVLVLLASTKALAAQQAAASPNKPLRILSIMTVDTMSHHLWMSPLTVELAKRGHHVEAVDVAMPKEVPPTLNVTVIENAFSMINEHGKFARYVSAGRMEQAFMLAEFSVDECDRDLVTPAMRRLLDPKYPGKFDLIVLDYLSDCMLGLVHRFDYPGLVAVSPMPGGRFLHDLKGNPDVPAIVPSSIVPHPVPMSLWQRAATAFYSAYHRFIEWRLSAKTDATLRRHFGDDVPSAEQLRRSVDVALLNENPILDLPRPYVPGLVPVGGLHVRPANMSNVPADLRQWMDSSPAGFVFVSFGSMMKGSAMSPATKRSFLDSFKELGDVRVLWKMEAEALAGEELPSNLRVQSWIPQNDVLGHSKLLLFVSHCGGLSTQESAFNGVPILGVPIMTDQFLNLDKMVRIGMARRMPFAEISKERFVAETKEMLQNSQYRDAARHTATLLHDQQNTPLDTAVWWCEYVARHRGAPHLRSPALDLSWPQVMLLDVMALLVLAVLAAVAVLILLLRTCLRCISSMSANAKAKTQ